MSNIKCWFLIQGINNFYVADGKIEEALNESHRYLPDGHKIISEITLSTAQAISDEDKYVNEDHDLFKKLILIKKLEDDAYRLFIQNKDSNISESFLEKDLNIAKKTLDPVDEIQKIICKIKNGFYDV